MTDFEQKLVSGLIVSFTIFIITQIITIFRDYKRRNQQFLKDVYLPLFSAIQKCYDTETNFRPDHDIINPLHIKELFQLIKKHIDSNISKCDIFILKYYYVYNYENTFDDFKGEKEYLEDMKLIAIFTHAFKRMYRRSYINEKQLDVFIELYNDYFNGLFYFTELLNDREKALTVSRMRWMLKDQIGNIFMKMKKNKVDADNAKKMLLNYTNGDEEKKMILSIFQ